MKKFRLYWLSGKTEVIEGKDFENAWLKTGFNSRVKTTLDFWSEGEEQKYTWNSNERMWIPKERKTQYQAGSIGGF